MDKQPGFDLAATDRYLRTRQAAAYLNIRESTLILWRREKRGPPPIRISANRCVYDRLGLDAFLASRTQTFEPSSAATSGEIARP